MLQVNKSGFILVVFDFEWKSHCSCNFWKAISGAERVYKRSISVYRNS